MSIIINRQDHRYSRRRLLAAASLSLLAGSARLRAAAAALLPAEKVHDLVNLRDFQAGGSADWSSALTQASAVALRIYIPAGEYPVRSAVLAPDTELFGDGDNSILRMPPQADIMLLADSGSESVASNINGIHLHDLQLRGTSDIDGFAEFRHLVSLNGVTEGRFTRVLFKGFRGDGLYLGAGTRRGVERHNVNIVVESCRFDGINRENRNAITAIDCDGLLIENCLFSNTTAPTMPGAIDLEPNAFPFHVIRNVIVRANRFEGIGGNVGVIAVYVPAQVERPPENITIEGNESQNYVGTGSFFHLNDNRRASEGKPENNVRVARNRASGGAFSFVIASGKRIFIEENTFTDFKRGGMVGAPGARHSVRDFQMQGNTMVRGGATVGSAVYLYTVEHARFSRNAFIDSGTTAAGSAVMFTVGQSSHIEFVDNDFRRSVGRGGYAIQADRRHVFEAATNRFVGNRTNGLATAFPTAD